MGRRTAEHPGDHALGQPLEHLRRLEPATAAVIAFSAANVDSSNAATADSSNAATVDSCNAATVDSCRR